MVRRKKKISFSLRDRDLPATMGLVMRVRDELKTEIQGVEKKIDGLSLKIDSKFDSMLVLMEEQRNENKAYQKVAQLPFGIHESQA